MALVGLWAKIGRETIEELLESHFGRTCPKIREDDEIELIARKMCEGNFGDFAWSLCFDPAFVSRLFSQGFLPIATELYHEAPPNRTADPLIVLLPKLHQHRCCLQLNEVRIIRSARKQARKYTFTVNRAFEQVVQGCHKQHGVSWLWPPVVDAFRILHKKVIHSIELWEEDTLVAGELGWSSGRVYTSLSGFYTKSGSGSVQITALGGLMHQCGYELWDLGMELPYKTDLGAKNLPREEFLVKFHSLRNVPPPIPIGDSQEESAKTLIEVLRTATRKEKETSSAS